MTTDHDSPIPTISVIIPTHNRLASLQRTIRSLLQQDLDVNLYEIIVVDDSSTDGTADYLRGISESNNLRFTTIRRSGPAVARNRGAELARGQILAFTDNDCLVPTTWLRNIRQILGSSPVAAVGGGLNNQVQTNIYSVVYAETNRFISAHLEEEGQAYFRPTCNFACRASVFNKHAGFDERFFLGSDDREFVARLIKADDKVLNSREIVVDHFHEFSLFSFLFHFFRLGRGSYLLFRVVAREKGLPIRRISAVQYIDLIKTVGRGHGFLESLQRTLLVLASQSSALLGYCTGFVRSASTSKSATILEKK